MSAVNGLADDELKLINEAVATIRGHSLIPAGSTRSMTEDIIRSYARAIDDYTDYLTGQEYAAYQESTSADYFGVEMDIQKKDGRIYIFPFRRGAAEKKGIQPGDELIAVDGAPVYGKSVYLVGSRIRGEEGSSVDVTIRTGNGIPRVVTLRRKHTGYRPVAAEAFGDVHLVEISRFTDKTPELLQQVLKGTAGGARLIIIDLRQNQGGSLGAAIACANFFVDPGAVLFRLRSLNETKDIIAESPSLTSARLLLIQDGSTASAAEAFTTALVSNGRALSVGEKSFGKGFAQRFLPLSDGSALLLTYAEILNRDNSAYNNTGLLPGRLLPAELLREDLHNEDSVRKLTVFLGMDQK